MLRRLASAVLLVSVSVLSAADPPAVPPKTGIVGIWEGPLKVGAVELRLAFHITQDKDGKLTTKLDSIDQGAKGMPVKETTFADKTLKLDMPDIKAKFTGTLAADGQSIKGDWEQAAKLPLELKRVEKASTLNRPQHPKKPYPYTAEEVSFENPAAKLTLAGTLTLPKGDGPFPAVVLITGSGPQDRDETLLGHKPFLVIADHLTRNGFAVLRCDDRGVGKSTGKQEGATSADFATDAYAAVKYLQTRKEIDGKRVGLMGHSEGGLIAPIVAADHPADIGFIVLLAGPGVPGDEILAAQSELIQKAMGEKPETVAVRLRVMRAMLAAGKAPGTKEERKAKLKAAAEAAVKALPEADRKMLEGDKLKADETTADATLERFADPWFQFFLSFDPRPTLAKVKCPVLAVNGELDLQVPHAANLAAIESAVKGGGNAKVTTRLFPGLNHLFQETKTGAPSEYGQIEQTFAPAALEAITAWLKANT